MDFKFDGDEICNFDIREGRDERSTSFLAIRFRFFESPLAVGEVNGKETTCVLLRIILWSLAALNEVSL